MRGRKARQTTSPLTADLTQTLLGALTHGVMVTDPNLVILGVNRAFTQLTGYPSEDAIGKSPVLLKSGRHGPAFYRRMWTAIEKNSHWEGEIWNRRRDGKLYLEWLGITALRDKTGRVTHYVGIFTDITERKRWEKKLVKLSFHDGLTGLPNRLLHRDRLEQAIIRARRRAHKTALLYLDIDDFKKINDVLGHASGDTLLRKLANRLKRCVRKVDTVARLAGDEFSVILPEIGGERQALMVAEKILARLTEPFRLAGVEWTLTASIGIAIFPDHGVTPKSLVENADCAMYAAKRRGRNCIEVYSRPGAPVGSRRAKVPAHAAPG